MARQRKSQSAETVTNVSSDTVENKNNYEEVINNLFKEIERLKKQIENDKETPLNISKNESYEGNDLDEFNKIKINQDDYIKVVSLTPFQLNLTCEPKGAGKCFTFRGFGQTKRVLYSDLVKILENAHSFLEKAYFYIMDKRVIRRHGLDDLYEKILTKEKIEAIIEGNSNDAVSLFKSASESQQLIIVEMLIEKLVKDPDSVDLNMVDKISRASGVKIQEKAEEGRELLNVTKESND